MRLCWERLCIPLPHGILSMSIIAARWENIQPLHFFRLSFPVFICCCIQIKKLLKENGQCFFLSWAFPEFSILTLLPRNWFLELLLFFSL